jgi:dihydrofolate reductase
LGAGLCRKRRLGGGSREIKGPGGKPIIAHGGASFARSLVAEALVDQYDLLVHPVTLRKGLPSFSDLAVPRPLKLMRSRAFPAGSVAQIYRPA